MRLDQGNDPTNSLLTAAAVRLGVTGTTVLSYLTGERYPNLTTVRRIEEEFHWPVDAQVRLIPAAGSKDLSYGTVLGEVLKENFPGVEPDFTKKYVRTGMPRRRPTLGGWTHAMVGKYLAVQHTSVSRWLTGSRYPELRTMLRIDRMLGWPVTEQVVLVPEEGYNDAWATAFKAVLDRNFPLKADVTKITSEKV